MSIPAVKLILVDKPTIASVPSASAKRSQHTERSPQTTADLRWSRVEEFLRSRELRPNTRKAYEREFKAFLGWTEKAWQDITARDLDRYKEYLKDLPSGRGGKRSRGSGSIWTKNDSKAKKLYLYRFQALFLDVFEAVKSLYVLMSIGFKEILFFEFPS
jgi:Phage integrase, N-terminal SAM-like domain